MGTIIFDGKDLADFGVVPTGSGTYGAPARKYNAIEIQGRNGEFIQDLGYFSNYNITYPCFINENFSERMQSLRNFLCSRSGYKKLYDSYDQDHYRMAYFSAEIVPETATRNMGARFELTFTCKPQRFLSSAETPINLSGSNTYPRTYEKSELSSNIRTIVPIYLGEGPYCIYDLGEPIHFDSESHGIAEIIGADNVAVMCTQDPLNSEYNTTAPNYGYIPERDNAFRYWITKKSMALTIKKVANDVEEILYTSAQNIIRFENISQFTSKPLVKLYRHDPAPGRIDAGVVTINGTDICTIDVMPSIEACPYYYVDFETMNVYGPRTGTRKGEPMNLNPYMKIDGKGELKSGINEIYIGSHIDAIDVVPRWFEL